MALVFVIMHFDNNIFDYFCLFLEKKSGINKLEWLTIPACPLTLQKFVFDVCVCTTCLYLCRDLFCGLT